MFQVNCPSLSISLSFCWYTCNLIICTAHHSFIHVLICHIHNLIFLINTIICHAYVIMTLLQFVLVYILLQPFGFSIISSEELLLSNELGHITQRSSTPKKKKKTHALILIIYTTCLQQLMLVVWQLANALEFRAFDRTLGRSESSKCFGVYIGRAF